MENAITVDHNTIGLDNAITVDLKNTGLDNAITVDHKTTASDNVITVDLSNINSLNLTVSDFTDRLVELFYLLKNLNPFPIFVNKDTKIQVGGITNNKSKKLKHYRMLT